MTSIETVLLPRSRYSTLDYMALSNQAVVIRGFSVSVFGIPSAHVQSHGLTLGLGDQKSSSTIVHSMAMDRNRSYSHSFRVT
jgi:ADP-dependent phosphofructokinase/glucokinase